MWLIYAPGSGIYFNLGVTISFAEHQDAYTHFNIAGGQDMNEALSKAAAAVGYDSIQFLAHVDVRAAAHAHVSAQAPAQRLQRFPDPCAVCGGMVDGLAIADWLSAPAPAMLACPHHRPQHVNYQCDTVNTGRQGFDYMGVEVRAPPARGSVSSWPTLWRERESTRPRGESVRAPDQRHLPTPHHLP